MLPSKLLYNSLFSYLHLKMERIEIYQICLLEYCEEILDLSACKHFYLSPTSVKTFHSRKSCTRVWEQHSICVYYYSLILNNFACFHSENGMKANLRCAPAFIFSTPKLRKTPRLIEI